MDTSAWDMASYLLGKPRATKTHNGRYIFINGSSYCRDEALNHHLDEQRTFRRGDVLDGMLLAQSFEPAPVRYQTGSNMTICLELRNQFDEVHESTFQVRVERTLQTGGRVQSSRGDSSLFEPAASPEPTIPANVRADYGRRSNREL